MDWISIKEKIPEVGKRVILFVVDKPQREGYYICCGSYFPNENVPSKFQLDSDSVADMLKDDRQITHWMHLPPMPIDSSKTKEVVYFE